MGQGVEVFTLKLKAGHRPCNLLLSVFHHVFPRITSMYQHVPYTGGRKIGNPNSSAGGFQKHATLDSLLSLGTVHIFYPSMVEDLKDSLLGLSR